MKLKNLLYLFLIPAMALSLTSCDDDEKDENTSIIGTWKFERIESTSVKSNNDLLTAALKKFYSDEDLAGHIRVFEKDSLYRFTEGDEIDDVRKRPYTYENEKLTTFSQDPEDQWSETVGFKISGKIGYETESQLEEYSDKEGKLYSWTISTLERNHPEVLADLTESEIDGLRITEFTVTKKYVKQ